MTISAIGIDLAKSIFKVHGVYATGKVVARKKLRRAEVLKFFKALKPCLVGIKACANFPLAARGRPQMTVPFPDARIFGSKYQSAIT